MCGKPLMAQLKSRPAVGRHWPNLYKFNDTVPVWTRLDDTVLTPRDALGPRGRRPRTSNAADRRRRAPARDRRDVADRTAAAAAPELLLSVSWRPSPSAKVAPARALHHTSARHAWRSALSFVRLPTCGVRSMLHLRPAKVRLLLPAFHRQRT